MYTNTNDLSEFGFRELNITIELLNAYLENPSILGSGVKVELNPNSGYVFLVDEDFNVAMMNGDDLELFLNCPYCGHEDFESEFSKPEESECSAYKCPECEDEF
jgi:hypothetical protein